MQEQIVDDEPEPDVYPTYHCEKCGEVIAKPNYDKYGGFSWDFYTRSGKRPATNIANNIFHAQGKCRNCAHVFALDLPPSRRGFSSTTVSNTGVDIDLRKYITRNEGTHSVQNGMIVCQCGQRIAYVEKRRKDSPNGFAKLGVSLIRETIIEVAPDDRRRQYTDVIEKYPHNDPSSEYYVFTTLNFTNNFASRRQGRFELVCTYEAMDGACQSCKRLHYLQYEERMQFLNQRIQEMEAEK